VDSCGGQCGVLLAWKTGIDSRRHSEHGDSLGKRVQAVAATCTISAQSTGSATGLIALNNSSFPLQGIIGIVANDASEVDLACDRRLQCIEIRADLLLDAGLNSDALLALVAEAKARGLAVLFTLRHPTHGGSYKGSEEQRADLSAQALHSGADIVDLEWDTEAATLLQDKRSQLLLSYHNFNGMPTPQELTTLTDAMCARKPCAIKIVPTAANLSDAVRMLQWAATPASSEVRRIGFAMGSAGACSRILTIAYGAPITYASFGEAVAPGQVALDSLADSYRAMDLNTQTQLVAVVGDDATVNERVRELNQQFIAAAENTVAIAFSESSAKDLQICSETLRLKDTVC